MTQIDNFREEVKQENSDLIRKVQKFKSTGNEIQHSFNMEVGDLADEAHDA